MRESVPLSAAGMPPETGASMKTPASDFATASPTARDAETSIVERSIRSLLERLGEPARRPVSGFSKTSETALANGSEVRIMS